jgi:hypothetical protein
MLWKHGLVPCAWFALKWWATTLERANGWAATVSVLGMLVPALLVLRGAISWQAGVAIAVLLGLPVLWEVIPRIGLALCWFIGIPLKEEKCQTKNS